MSDFLTRLAQRAVGQGQRVHPLVAPLYAPSRGTVLRPTLDDGLIEERVEVDASAAPDRPRPALDPPRTIAKPSVADEPARGVDPGPEVPQRFRRAVPAPAHVGIAGHAEAAYEASHVEERRPEPTARRDRDLSGSSPLHAVGGANDRPANPGQGRGRPELVSPERSASVLSAAGPYVALPADTVEPDRRLGSIADTAGDRQIAAGAVDPEGKPSAPNRTTPAPTPDRHALPVTSRPGEPVDATPGPTIHVTIGRIEVRAEISPAPRRPERERWPLSLDDYLRQRDGGAR